jgi:hypothetical protein
MEVDARTLRQLIQGSMYVVDERAVADAIVLRIRLRATVARPSLHNERREVEVRSFRRDPRARSFRLARGHASSIARR